MKRNAARQFDAKSTEPADTHNHFTTHMPVAHARQHRSTSNHDPHDRVQGRWEEETTGKDTPRPPGTRATKAPGGPRKPPEKKKFPARRHPIGAHRTTTLPTEFTDDGKRKRWTKHANTARHKGHGSPRRATEAPQKKKFSEPTAPYPLYMPTCFCQATTRNH